MSRTRRVPADRRTHRPKRVDQPEEARCPDCGRRTEVARGGYRLSDWEQLVWYCEECV